MFGPLVILTEKLIRSIQKWSAYCAEWDSTVRCAPNAEGTCPERTCSRFAECTATKSLLQRFRIRGPLLREEHWSAPSLRFERMFRMHQSFRQ